MSLDQAKMPSLKDKIANQAASVVVTPTDEQVAATEDGATETPVKKGRRLNK